MIVTTLIYCILTTVHLEMQTIGLKYIAKV